MSVTSESEDQLTSPVMVKVGPDLLGVAPLGAGVVVGTGLSSMSGNLTP